MEDSLNDFFLVCIRFDFNEIVYKFFYLTLENLSSYLNEFISGIEVDLDSTIFKSIFTN